MTGPAAGAEGVSTPDLLEAIVAATRRSVAVRMEATGRVELERMTEGAMPRGETFRANLTRRGTWNVIAECKRRSPSRGILREVYDPAAIARSYEAAGAAAISVLTEPTFFDGSREHVRAVRATVALPILWKDFVVTPYQLVEARAAGADAALLIVAALDTAALKALTGEAQALGLATLVEVHDASELARALDAGANIVGVNNRNLRTLDVVIDTACRLGERMPENVVAVAESGLRTSEDLVRLRSAGYQAFLIGESLMSAPDPGDALRTLLSAQV